MGIFDRLRQGLSKTREKIAQTFRVVLPIGRPVDDEVLDKLEAVMLAADMGPSTVAALIAEVRAAWKRGAIKETQDINPFLQSRLIERWPDEDRRLHFAAQGPTVILVAGINGSGKTTSIAKLAA